MMHSPPAQSHKGTKTLIWVSAIVVVLAALITWAVLDYDRISGWFEKGEAEVTETPAEVTPDEAVVEEEPIAEEEAEEEQPEMIQDEPEAVEVEPVEVAEEPPAPVAEEPVSAGPKFYVIAGSFKVESNATNYTNKLKAEGYNSQNLGLIKGYHIVTFDGFEDYQDAMKLYKMVKADQPDAWIMKY